MLDRLTATITLGTYAADLQRSRPPHHDDQGTPETNPDFDHLLRGTVHDPTTRRMGGVAGQAGVFSTAEDVAQIRASPARQAALRQRPFPLKQSTLKLMTTPEQPSTAQPGATIFTPDGKTTTGIAVRGFGWDINSAYSRPRGSVFPISGSFGHTGFTGTSLWMDPASDTYVVLLANAIHPRGNSAHLPPPRRSRHRRRQCTRPCSCTQSSSWCAERVKVPSAAATARSTPTDDPAAPPQFCEPTKSCADRHRRSRIHQLRHAQRPRRAQGGHLRIGLLTNQTGLDAHGRRTIDVLRGIGSGIELTTLFSPEHGIFGARTPPTSARKSIPPSGLKVISLYGAKDADSRPKPEDLKNLDAVVIDLQDAGVRFYTYETVLGYFLEAAACEVAHGHPLEIIVLDRPALIGGQAVQGPVSDTAGSYINYMPSLSQRHDAGRAGEVYAARASHECDATREGELSEHAEDDLSG